MIGTFLKKKQTGLALTHDSQMWRYFRKLIPGAQAYRMAKAYGRVFRHGGDSQEDREMVLIDLAQKAGWNRVPSPSGRNNELYELGVSAGKQEVFAHIYNLLRLSPQEIAGFEKALRDDLQEINGAEDPNLRSQYLA